MKIAAFYENIVEGARASGVSLESAVRDLMQEGLELLYISGFAYKDAEDEIERLIKSTGVGVECKGHVDRYSEAQALFNALAEAAKA